MEKTFRIPITLFVESNNYGGAEIYVLRLIEELDIKQFEIRLIIQFSKESEKTKRFIEKARKLEASLKLTTLFIVRSNVEGFKQFFEFRTIKQLIRIFSERKQIIHFNRPLSVSAWLGVSIALLLRKPTIQTMHGSHEGWNRAWYSRPRLRYEFSTKFADLVIAVSNALRKELIEMAKVDQRKLMTIHNWINVSEYRQNLSRISNKKGEIEQKIGIRLNEKVVFLIVARISPEKGIEDVIYALAELKQRTIEDFSKITVIVAGEGDSLYVRSIQQLIVQTGVADAIKLLGFREDIPSLIDISDAVLLASKAESFGLVLVEAMSLSKPVLASTGGGIPEVVINDETGLLFEKGNPHALADAILKFMRLSQNDRQIMGEKGFISVQQKFDAKVQVKKIEQIYRVFWNEKLLKRRNAV